MNRRDVLAMLSMALTGAHTPAFAQPLPVQSVAGVVPPDHPLQASWEIWKSLYLRPDGRVVDGYQDNASHSEGQGYGLTLAAAFGDLPVFETIFRWTEEHLAIRADALLAWRWLPDQSPYVPDTNNASDGDLFYAWALAAMAARHDRPDFADRAAQITRDLARLCVVSDPSTEGRFLFLPAAEGFVRDGSYIINPSYYMPRAMRELAVMTGVDLLAKVAADADVLFADIADAGLDRGRCIGMDPSARVVFGQDGLRGDTGAALCGLVRSAVLALGRALYLCCVCAVRRWHRDRL